jgi:hypothetical protein
VSDTDKAYDSQNVPLELEDENDTEHPEDRK